LLSNPPGNVAAFSKPIPFDFTSNLDGFYVGTACGKERATIGGIFQQSLEYTKDDCYATPVPPENRQRATKQYSVDLKPGNYTVNIQWEKLNAFDSNQLNFDKDKLLHVQLQDPDGNKTLKLIQESKGGAAAVFPISKAGRYNVNFAYYHFGGENTATWPILAESDSNNAKLQFVGAWAARLFPDWFSGAATINATDTLLTFATNGAIRREADGTISVAAKQTNGEYVNVGDLEYWLGEAKK
jgi:hypothetical protein